MRVVVVVLALLAGFPVASPSFAQGTTPGSTRSFRELGYGDLTARTMHGSLNYFFPVPRGLAPQAGSKLDLVISHSPLLVADRSTVTVIANGRSLESAFLTRDNVTRARLTVALPIEGFVATGYFIEIRFAMLLTRDECEETTNPALWATVHGESSATLTVAPSTSVPTLVDLPGLFAPPVPPPTPVGDNRPAAMPPTVAIVVPSTLTTEEIEAAGLAAYQVGRWAAAGAGDPIIGVSRSPVVNRPNIIVGSDSALAAGGAWGGLNWGAQGFDVSGVRVPAAHGVIALARDGSTPRLLISGGSPGAVRLAAENLTRTETRSLLARDYALVTGTQPAPLAARVWESGAASFAQLGMEKRVVTGLGEHTFDLFFERPAGWVLQRGTTLDLDIEGSASLRTETSWVAATVNGIDIGTRRLDSATTPGVQRFRFELPFDSLNTSLDARPLRALGLQLRFHLDVPQTGCTQASPASAWVAVLPTSTWLMPHSDYTGMDLGRFPSPFVGLGGTTRTIVALPDQPTDAELSAGLQVMTALGRWTVGDPTALPRLTLGSSQDPTGVNVVLIGTPDRNSLSALANKVPGLFERGEPVVYQLDPGVRRGFLRLAESPWSKERTVLALMGEGERGLNLAALALTRAELRTDLRGRAASVVDGLPAQTIEAAVPPVLPPGSLAPRLETPPPRFLESLPAWQIVGVVLLGGFLAGLAIIFSVRWRRKLRG